MPVQESTLSEIDLSDFAEFSDGGSSATPRLDVIDLADFSLDDTGSNNPTEQDWLNAGYQPVDRTKRPTGPIEQSADEEFYEYSNTPEYQQIHKDERKGMYGNIPVVSAAAGFLSPDTALRGIGEGARQVRGVVNRFDDYATGQQTADQANRRNALISDAQDQSIGPRLGRAVASTVLQAAAPSKVGKAASVLGRIPGILGTTAVPAYFGASEYNQALTQGADSEANLRGGELQRYAISRGANEAVVTAAFSAIPGLVKATPGLAKKIPWLSRAGGTEQLVGDMLEGKAGRGLVGELAKSIPAELAEELTILAIGEHINQNYKIRPNETKEEYSQRMYGKDWSQGDFGEVGETALQTVATVGSLGSVQAVGSAIGEARSKAEREKLAAYVKKYGVEGVEQSVVDEFVANPSRGNLNTLRARDAEVAKARQEASAEPADAIEAAKQQQTPIKDRTDADLESRLTELRKKSFLEGGDVREIQDILEERDTRKSKAAIQASDEDNENVEFTYKPEAQAATAAEPMTWDELLAKRERAQAFIEGNPGRKKASVVAQQSIEEIDTELARRQEALQALPDDNLNERISRAEQGSQSEQRLLAEKKRRDASRMGQIEQIPNEEWHPQQNLTQQELEKVKGKRLFQKPEVTNPQNLAESSEVSTEESKATSKFQPTSEWQEIPEGYVAPAGMQFKMDVTTKKSYVRDPKAPPVATRGQAVSGGIQFTTEKGSTYQVDEQGRTIRNKSLHVGHDAKDVGIKEKSTKTVYVSPQAAGEIGLIGQLQGANRKVIFKNGRVYPASWNEAEKKWGVEPRNKSGYEVSDTPAVGLAPVELWGEPTNGPQGEEWGQWHPGNKITKISPQPSKPIVTGPNKVTVGNGPLPKLAQGASVEWDGGHGTVWGDNGTTVAITTVNEKGEPRGIVHVDRNKVSVMTAETIGLEVGDKVTVLGGYPTGFIYVGMKPDGTVHVREDGGAHRSMYPAPHLVIPKPKAPKAEAAQPSEQIDTVSKPVSPDKSPVILTGAKYSGVMEAIRQLLGFSERLDSENRPGETIGQHTENVLRNFTNNTTPAELKAITSAVDASKVMPVVIAIHDIGKADAIKAGDKTRQHEFTIPLAIEAASGLGLSEAEANVATSLIADDSIGLMLKGELSPQKAAESIVQSARRANMPVGEFFKLQTLMYKSDAGAYPALQKKLFSKKGDKMFVAKEKFGILEEIIHGEVQETPWIGSSVKDGREQPRGGSGYRGTSGFVHGTGTEFDQFSAEYDSGRNIVGPGAYLLSEEDSDVAGHYAERAMKKLLALFSDKTRKMLNGLSGGQFAEFIERAKDNARKLQNGNPKESARWNEAARILELMQEGKIGKKVLDVAYTPKKIFDMGAHDSSGRILSTEDQNEILANFPGTVKAVAAERAFSFYESLAKQFGKPAVNEAILSAGYDTIHFVHKSGGYNRPYSVFVALSHQSAKIKLASEGEAASDEMESDPAWPPAPKKKLFERRPDATGAEPEQVKPENVQHGEYPGKSGVEVKKKTETLREVRDRYKAKIDAIDAEFNTTEKELGRQKSKALKSRNSGKVADLESEYQKAKEDATGKRQAVYTEMRTEVESHPEYIAEKADASEKAKVRREQDDADIKSNNEAADKGKWEDVQKRGGYEFVRSSISSDIRKVNGSLARAKEGNKFKFESRVKMLEKQLDYLDFLNDKFGKPEIDTVSKPPGTGGDENIGREWDSPYGRQRIVSYDGNGLGMYTVETIESGVKRSYGANRIEDIIRGNEYELTPEYESEVEEKKAMAADRDRSKKNQEEKEAKVKAEIAEFTVGKPVIEAGRISKVLLTTVKYNGNVTTRKGMIEGVVRGGAKIVSADEGRRLEKPNGSFLSESTTTKIGMNYAEWLLAKEPDTDAEATAKPLVANPDQQEVAEPPKPAPNNWELGIKHQINALKPVLDKQVGNETQRHRKWYAAVGVMRSENPDVIDALVSYVAEKHPDAYEFANENSSSVPIELKEAIKRHKDNVTKEKLRSVPKGEFARTTPPESDSVRQMWKAEVQRNRDVELRIQGDIKKLRSSLSSTRKGSKKRRDIEGEISEKERAGQTWSDERMVFENKLRVAELEDYVEENQGDEFRKLHAMYELRQLEARTLFNEARKPVNSSQGFTVKAEAKQTAADSYAQELLDLIDKEIGDDSGLNKDEREFVRDEVFRGIGLRGKSPVQDAIKSKIENAKSVRAGTRYGAIERIQNISDEQKKAYRDRLNEAAKNSDWFDKSYAIIKEAQSEGDKAAEAKRKEAAKEAEAAAVEREKEEATELKDRRTHSRENRKEKKYFADMAERAKSIKGKKQDILVADKKGDKTITRNGTVIHPDWAITESKGEATKDLRGRDKDGKDEFTLTHIPTGMSAGTWDKASYAKQQYQMWLDAGIDPAKVVVDGKVPGDLGKRLGSLSTSLESEHLTNSPDRDTLLALAVPAETTVKADIVLDSHDMGMHDAKLKKNGENGIAIIDKMTKRSDGQPPAVPEFAYNPVFTVNDKKQLVFQDGFKFVFPLKNFNLHPSEVEPGMTVGINLEDMGYDRATEEEVVRDMLKNHGMEVGKSGKGMSAKFDGKVAIISGSGQSWTASGDPGAVKMAQDVIDGIRWVQPGQPGGKMKVHGTNPTGQKVEPVVKEPVAAEPGKPAKPLKKRIGSKKKDGDKPEVAKLSGAPSAPTNDAGLNQNYRGPKDTEPGVSFQQLKTTWERIFGTPVRLSYFNDKARGIYKYFFGTNVDVARLSNKDASSAAVAAHEISHGIDRKYGITQGNTLPENILNELYGWDHSKKGKVEEGVAEYMRFRLLHPDGEVEVNFPLFHAWFENWLKNHPDLRKKLDEGRKYGRMYGSQPEYQRLAANIGNAGDDLSPAERWKKTALNAVSEADRLYFDANRPWAELTKFLKDQGGDFSKTLTPEEVIRNYSGTVGHRAEDAFINGPESIMSDKRFGTGLLEIKEMLNTEGELQEAYQYAWARHVLYRADTDPNWNGGMSVEQAQRIMDATKAEAGSKYEKFAEKLSEYAFNLYRIEVDAGRMGQDEFDTIFKEYGDGKHYLPMERQHPDAKGGNGSGIGLADVQPSARRRGRGADLPPKDFLEQLYVKTYRTYDTTMRWKTNDHLLRTVDPLLDKSAVKGAGWIADRIDPKSKKSEVLIERFLDQMVDQGHIDEDVAEDIKTAGKILKGANMRKSALERFANRHGVDIDDDTELRAAAKAVPATVNIWSQNLTSDPSRAIIAHRSNGEIILYQVDRTFYDLAMNAPLEVSTPFKAIIGMMGTFSSRAVTTWNTGFLFSNMPRDWMDANPKHAKGFAFFKSLQMLAAYGVYKAGKAEESWAGTKTIKSFTDMLRKNTLGKDVESHQALLDLFDSSGGKLFSGYAGRDVKNRVRRKLGIKAESMLEQGRRIYDAALEGISSVEEFSAITDAPVRLAEGDAIAKEMGFYAKNNKWYSTDTNQEVTLPEYAKVRILNAMAEATTNFKKRGAGISQIKWAMPLVGAQLAGLRKEIEYAVNLKNLGNGTAEDYQARKTLIKYAAYIAVTAALSFLRKDDDDWKESESKYDNFEIYGDKGRTIISLPMPRNTGGLLSGMTIALIDSIYNNGEGKRTPLDVIRSEVSERLPTGGGVVKATLESLTNYSTYRNRKIVNDYMGQRVPRAQFDKSTLEASKWVANTSVGKLLRISPIAFQYWADNSLGGQYVKWGEYAERKLGMREANQAKDWGVGRFLPNRHQQGSLNDFYEELGGLREELKGQRAELKAGRIKNLNDEAVKRDRHLSLYEDLIADIRKEPGDNLGYMVGLAREALGMPELADNKNPLYDKGTPAPVRALIKKFMDGKVESVMLAHDIPTKALPGDATWQDSYKKWEAGYEADMKWIEEHKASPYIAQAIADTKRKPAFRDRLRGSDRPNRKATESHEDYKIRYERWKKKLDVVRSWASS